MLGVFHEVSEERSRQDRKWGEQNYHPAYWFVILGAEVGEMANAFLESRQSDYRTELIHVAAVAIAAIESLDRGHWRSEQATPA